MKNKCTVNRINTGMNFIITGWQKQKKRDIAAQSLSIFCIRLKSKLC